jgi:acyl-CoA synthetase (AMP-forming)/AMP-acid ligase II
MRTDSESSALRSSGAESNWRTRAFMPDPRLTFPAVFAQRVAAAAGRVALSEVSFLRREPLPVPFTFAELDALVRSAVVDLEREGIQPGDRVVLCLGSAAQFLSFFLATQALGAIPVPLPSISDFQAPAAFRERVGGVMTDCEPRVVVVDSARGVEGATGPGAARPVCIDTSARAAAPVTTTRSSLRFDRSFHETAFIQYTSGSTGSPKGVVVTHRNLVSNMRASTESARFGPVDRSLSWLPLYHDMGLVGGLLLGLYLGIDTFIMPTRSFVGRPDSWLRAMSRFKATFSCAPNFAYSILARRLPESALEGIDLSSWRLAFNGAEPIDLSTLEDFASRFAKAGLSRESLFPVYGMAECTLAVAFPTPGAPVRRDVVDRDLLSRARRAVPVDVASPTGVSFASVGRALPGHSVRILDPEGVSELPERQLGEIAVSGPSVSPHYFRIDGSQGEPRRELRTGDLGYIANGDLYIVDRIKDLLIIAGRNYVPSDIERVVSEVPGVRYGSVVAFAIRGTDGTDELYLVVGSEPRSALDADLRHLVSERVHERFGLAARDIVIVKPGMVPKTSSGKIKRLACKELYERGGYRAEGCFRRSSRPPPAL